MPAFKSLLVLQYILSALDVRVRAQTTASPPASSVTACASSIAPKNAAPSVASGWRAEVVANKLKSPRGILFDKEGGLLVVEQERGISRLTLNDEAGSCVRQDGKSTLIIDDDTLNHGLQLSDDGKTLYASSLSSVYTWDYDASKGRNTSKPREIIGQLGGADGHVTRTLLLSRKVPDLLLVSRGSLANLDPSALDISSGVSTIKAFNISNVTDTAYNHAKEGVLLGWGLRNSVGVGEEPVTGAIYSVENSVDEFEREGKNIHQNNPGEEMNFHGYLNGTKSDVQGGNYGYPSCYAAWNVNEIPSNDGIKVGTQFAIGEQNATVNDTFCKEDRVPPRLTFAAHMAPLDIKFNDNGSAAWVTFHGSWDRTTPIGYKLAVIPFDGNGSPTASADSNSSTIDILTNPDLSKCPDECVRPVGLAWDSKGRLFMSSDATGEIWVITREDGESANGTAPTGTGSGSASGTGSAPSASSSSAAAVAMGAEMGWNVAEFAALWAGIMGMPLM